MLERALYTLHLLPLISMEGEFGCVDHQQQDSVHACKARIGQNVTREDVMISQTFFPLAVTE